MEEGVPFGRQLRELRKARGIDQRELARRVDERLQAQGGRGFDVSYLSKIENNRLPPPSEAAIVILADILETDRDDFLALAGKFSTEIGRTLRESRGARLFFRSAQQLNLSDEEWRELAERLRRSREDE